MTDEPFVVPASIQWLSRYGGGADWLDALPSLVAEQVQRWNLVLGSSFPGSNVSYVAPVTRTDGTHAILKVQWPHRDCEHEAAALAHWNGQGAVRLLAHDAEQHTLLLERCEPGTYLASAADPLAVFTELLPRLWTRAGVPFTPLADQAAHLADHLVGEWEEAGQPCGRRLVDAALGYLRDLPSSQGEQVLLHQDLHGHNVLAAQREPWLVIDPKPLVGEREFGLAPIVRSAELGHTRDQVCGRLDRLTSDLGLDRERTRGWAIAQTVAWGIEHPERHLAAAQWLLDDA